MELAEADCIIDYFHGATPEHLEQLGVDPSRLPDRTRWREILARELGLPIPERRALAVLWEADGRTVGFSTADKITFGREAHMHLHVVDPERRRRGVGVACVRETVKLYFELLRLERLWCEPNAFNVAPNRTLQRAGFTYVKTHRTVPGWINFHQPVTQWVIARPP
jgi:RimJ/RimL family protein N-acetyltransferase